MKTKLKLAKLILLTTNLFIANNVFCYSSRMDLHYKGGNIRHIGRYGILIPIYGQQDNLLFTNMFFMHDSKYNLEGNFGLGFRKKYQENFIIGTYGFWDIRKIKNTTKKIHQATFGIEYMTNRFEARINGYIPQNKNFLTFSGKRLNSHFNNSITTHSISNYQNYAAPLNGFDIEIGSHPLIDRVQLSVTYFNFFGKKQIKSIRGIRFRTNIKLNQLIAATGELSSGTNNMHYYLGIKISLNLNQKNIAKYCSLNILPTTIDYKMNQMIVRDLDIIAANFETSQNIYTEHLSNYVPVILDEQSKNKLGITDVTGNAAFQNKESAKLIIEIQKNGLSNITIIEESSLHNYKFSPLIINASQIDENVATKIETIFVDEYDALKFVFSNKNIANTIIQHKNTYGKLSNTTNSIWQKISSNSRLERLKQALYSSSFTSSTKANLTNRPVKTYYNGTVQNVAALVHYINIDDSKSYYLFGEKRGSSKKWAFPGGGVDGADVLTHHSVDASYEEAMFRELHEETNIDGKKYVTKGATVKHIFSTKVDSRDYRDNIIKPHETHFYILELGILNSSDINKLHNNTKAASDLTQVKFISRDMIDSSGTDKKINIPGKGWTSLVYPSNVNLVNINEKLFP